MFVHDLKYLASYLIPLLMLVGLWLGGWWAYGPVIFAFGLVPLLDQFTPQNTQPYQQSEEQARLGRVFFDWLLYLNVPIIYGLTALTAWRLLEGSFASWEWVGFVLSLGINIGACGINVAHELGHRPSQAEQWMAKALLLPALYTHFTIEHNLGHHRYVATTQDPATARRNEVVFFFWFRSWLMGYLSAWRLQIGLLRRKNQRFLSQHNQLLIMQLAQIGYLALLVYAVGWQVAGAVALAGMVGFLLLETINYIEHYGLLRHQDAQGRYERVKAWHSWNSNHQLGRIILYELTRHSDHHFKANKKYQILAHHEQAPQLPLGYPGAMLMSFVPPLWFWTMNRRLDRLSLGGINPSLGTSAMAG